MCPTEERGYVIEEAKCCQAISSRQPMLFQGSASNTREGLPITCAGSDARMRSRTRKGASDRAGYFPYRDPLRIQQQL